MIAYKIMLVMLIFSAVCGGLNSLGWYTQKLPEQKASINQADVVEFTEGINEISINPLTGITTLSTFLGVASSMFLALLTIVPFLMAFGVDYQIALMIQVPVWLVLIWALYEVGTGHTTTIQE